MASVCQTGDHFQLQLTCSTNGRFLRWIINLRNDQGRLQEYTRLISQDGSQQTHESEITINSTMITFMRTSAEGSSPLTSILVINSVGGALNGTVVHCVDVGTSVAANTTIRLFDISTYP